MKTKETKRDVLRRLAKANPNTTKSQLARIALRRYPGMFSSFDVARAAVRDIFGAHGTLKRAITANKGMFVPHGTVFDGIPEPKQDLVWKPGFSLVHRDDENNFTVDDKIVLDGKVY